MFCRRDVDSSLSGVAYPITGFETTRHAGGANRILGRQRVPERVAHALCAERHVRERERGLVGQEALL
jgi:hypothetical protein